MRQIGSQQGWNNSRTATFTLRAYRGATPEPLMTDDNDAKGPDLSKGIAAGDLAEGKTLAGHLGDDEIVLVRHGGKVSAVSAHCTHYHGPLADGLVVGNTVRCPWHHACFDLTSGEALAAPALSPLTCWKVEERRGRIVIGDKIDQPAPRKTGAA